jgi:hypothetical protein
MRRILLATLIIMVVQNAAFCQLDEVCAIMGPQDSTEWGIGAIKWDGDKYVKGYNEKNRTTYTISASTIRLDNSTTIPLNRADILFAGHYGNIFLKVFEIRNTSYKVMMNSVDGGLWIDFNEFNSKGLTFNTYYSILFNDNPNSNEKWRNSLGSLGVNLFRSCLNLRAGPTKDSQIIKCISKNVNDNRFHRVSIQHHEEAWAFIIVQEYVPIPDNGEYGEGCAFKIEKEYRGWARVIDEKGYPNLWYGLTKY